MSSSSPTTLSQLQFEVLRALLHADKPLTQRELHQLTDIPGQRQLHRAPMRSRRLHQRARPN